MSDPLERVICLWNRMDSSTAFGRMVQDGMEQNLKSHSPDGSMEDIHECAKLEESKVNFHQVLTDVLDYMDSFLVGDVERNGMSILAELKQERDESDLCFLQRHFQLFKPLSDDPPEGEALKTLLSKLKSAVTEELLRKYGVDQVSFENTWQVLKELDRNMMYMESVSVQKWK